MLSDGSDVGGRAPRWWQATVSLKPFAGQVIMTAWTAAWLAVLISCASYVLYFIAMYVQTALLPLVAGSAGFL